MRLKLKRVKWLMQCVLFVYGDLQPWHSQSGMILLPAKVLAGRTRRSMQAKPWQMCKLGWVQHIQLNRFCFTALMHSLQVCDSKTHGLELAVPVKSKLVKVGTLMTWKLLDRGAISMNVSWPLQLVIYFRSICSLCTWLCHVHPLGVSGGLVPPEKATCLECKLKVT